MPLIIVCGYPASGKTTRSLELATALRGLIARSTNPAHQNLSVSVVNDESLGLERAVYTQTRSEKDARAAFSSAVNRELGRERIVLADGMNYIKGFRYQMYCEARAVGTPSCCLHVATIPAHSHELNAKIEADKPGASYPPDLLENLIFRFEEPSGFARWDSPLFTLPAEDATTPAEAIFYALVGGTPQGQESGRNEDNGSHGSELKRVRPNLATVAPVQTDADALQRVDRVCAAVVKRIQEHMTDRGTEAESQILLGVPALEETRHDKDDLAEASIKMPAGGFTLAGLQRLKREFVGLIRANPAAGRRQEANLKAEFGSYVNRRTWEDD